MDRLALDGLASGFPTTDIVDQLMEIESLPLKRIEERSEKAEELRNAWRDVNTRVSNLDRTLDALLLRSNFDLRSVTSSDEKVVTATASTVAEMTDYEVEVIQLAVSHQIEITLGEEEEALEDGWLYINGVSIEIKAGNTLNVIRDRINAKSGIQEEPEWTTVQGTEDNLRALLLENDLDIEEINIIFALPGETLEVEGILDNGVLDLTITLEEDGESNIVSTLQQVIDAVEGLDTIAGFDFGEVEADTLGQLRVLELDALDPEYIIEEVPAEDTKLSDPFLYEYIEAEARIIGDSLLLRAFETGTENEISFDYDIETGLIVDQDFRTPQDADLTIEGVSIHSSTNTVQGAVEGVIFELKGEGQAKIEISIDSNTPADALEAFAEQYNSTMDFISTKLEYDQETGVAGKLQGNTTLMRIQSQIRTLLTGRVPTGSEYSQMVVPMVQTSAGPLSFQSSIGLQLDRDGVMSFDRAAFEKAHQSEPDAVTKLFAAREGTEGFDGAAISLRKYMDDILRHTVGVIPRQLRSQDLTIRNLQQRQHFIEDRLERVRDRYYRQFIAMEQALSSMMAQQQWLTGQIENLYDWRL